MTYLWTPRGIFSLEVAKVDKAVNEYDERLYFTRNEETGDWCIFMKMPHGERDLPVLGFQQIPHPDDALKRLYHADTLRHGERILDDMNRKNEALSKVREDKASDASGMAAEGLEWGYRRMGKHPVSRIFVPDKEISNG